MPSRYDLRLLSIHCPHWPGEQVGRFYLKYNPILQVSTLPPQGCSGSGQEQDGEIEGGVGPRLRRHTLRLTWDVKTLGRQLIRATCSRQQSIWGKEEGQAGLSSRISSLEANTMAIVGRIESQLLPGEVNHFSAPALRDVRLAPPYPVGCSVQIY